MAIDLPDVNPVCSGQIDEEKTQIIREWRNEILDAIARNTKPDDIFNTATTIHKLMVDNLPEGTKSSAVVLALVYLADAIMYSGMDIDLTRLPVSAFPGFIGKKGLDS